MKIQLERPVPVARAEDIPLWEARRVTVAGRRLAVVHTPGGFHAVDADCPHRGGPLADGLVGDGCITCPLHNWRIDLRSGEVMGEEEGRVAVHRVHERQGWIYVALSPAAPVPQGACV
jgi:nitrite reductase (NADH) small subunit